MSRDLQISHDSLTLSQIREFVFGDVRTVCVDERLKDNMARSEKYLNSLLEKRIPVYGVTTGYGANATRLVDREFSKQLQNNLISYLTCATGAVLPKEVSRAAMLFRLISLSRGLSGVSFSLVERLQMFLNADWIPVVPREGSLGASGDLIPLAYIAQALCGKGELHANAGVAPADQVLAKAGVTPYELQPKEGLALVNGTSTMAAYALYNLENARLLYDHAVMASSWLCIALGGRTEAFEALVNEKAKQHPGQARAARQVRELLCEENYSDVPLSAVKKAQGISDMPIQDQYSLRCVPQILGPILDTIELNERWLETELNGVSDNPLFESDGKPVTGGNFYGGYLSHGMDYLKISLAHMADLMDRQLMLLFNDKTSRGLPPNLIDTQTLSADEQCLHHGLKGLHQSVSALTSEILPKSIPNGIFSRSSESHNQDKVSLGMSAASQCADMIETLFTVQAMFFACGAQALELRGVQLKGARSQAMYRKIRECIPKVSHDRPLGKEIMNLAAELKKIGRRDDK